MAIVPLAEPIPETAIPATDVGRGRGCHISLIDQQFTYSFKIAAIARGDYDVLQSRYESHLYLHA
jgi:hypothetical protein